MERPDREVQKIKGFVEEALAEDERCRNSDHWLILEVLRKMGFKIYINYDELSRMPSFETITRCRRFLQNAQGKYSPRPEVDRFREIKREENRTIWRNSYLS